MVLDTVILSKDAFEALDPVLQGEYEENGGNYYLKTKATRVGRALYSLEDVTGLKTAVEKQKKEVANLTRLVDGLKGEDGELPEADAVRDALEKVKEMEKWTPNEKVQETVAAKERALQKKHEAEAKKLTAAIEKLKGRVEDLLIPSKASALLASKKYTGSSAKLLMPAIRARAKVQWGDDFSDTLNVYDENGEMMVNPEAGATGSAHMEHLLEAMSGDPEYKPGFGGTLASGSGGTHTDGRSPIGGLRKMTQEEANDPKKYTAMKELCEKAGADIMDYLP